MADDNGLHLITVQGWVEELTRLNTDYRQNTFVFWPVGERGKDQLEAFAKEVVPAVKDAVQKP